MLSLFYEFISSHLHILIEQVASEDLLSILKVDLIGEKEQESEGGFSHKLQVLVVEEYIVVVKEQELCIAWVISKWSN